MTANALSLENVLTGSGDGGGALQPQAAVASLFADVAHKLGGDLATLALGLAAAPSSAAQTQSAAIPGLARAAPQMTIIDGMVAVDISSVDGNIEGLLHQLETLGLQSGSTWGNTLSGLLPIESLVAASHLANLNQARAAMAYGQTGDVTSQGDAALHADDARGAFGVDGSGVTVGVLSDSFDNLGGAASGITSGDLPAGGVQVLVDLPSGGTDEGRAMLEIVHDVAPGAALQFRTAFLGQADFANGIQQLIAAGADIIVDDIFYFAEPFFQDGIIAQSADLAVQKGVAYFTAAGNSGDNSYEDTFRDSGATISYTNQNGVAITNAQLHDFDPGAGVDTRQSITFAGTTATGGATNRFRIALQWDDPFSSVSAASGGAVNDYDFLLTDDSGAIVSGLTASTSIIGGDAFEFFDITYSGAAPLHLNLSIARASGSTASLLKTVVFQSRGFTLDEFDTHSSTAVGHANAELAQSVGAADFRNTPEFGVTPAVNETFSSLGGTATIFDPFGNRLATPIVRQAVDMTAPDGADTTFFGSDNSDAGTFPNFFGTSAAAPHAAAVAALLLARNPNATPDDLFLAMTSTAHDMGAAGVDQLSGAGLIDARLATRDLNLDDVLVGTGVGESLSGLLGDDVLTGRGGNDTLIGGTGADILVGGAGDDTYVDPKGDTINELADGGQDTVESPRTFSLEAIAQVEDLVLTGAANSAGTGNTLGNRITGNTGNNSLSGLAGNDTLSGGDGSDDLRGGTGVDRMNGGLGNDRFFVDASGDQTIETSASLAIGGIDTVFSTVDRTLGANLENLRLQGTGGLSGNGNELNNKIFGTAGANLLRGLAGDDTIEGKDGADTIDGGEGNDTLSGGSQADVFRFAISNAGVDRILDFNKNGDRFDLSGGTFTAVSIAPNGDALLTHNGGTIRIASPPNLTLEQWQALILPSSAKVADGGPGSIHDGATAAEFGATDWHGSHLALVLRSDFIAGHGDWPYA